MAVRIKLVESDQARYDVPEWLDFDAQRPMLSQVRLLKEQAGMSWADMRASIADGGLEAIAATLWLAVRGAGSDVTWADFDVDIAGADIEKVDDDPNSLALDGAKPISTPSAPTSSATTASSPGKSPASRARSSKR